MSELKKDMHLWDGSKPWDQDTLAYTPSQEEGRQIAYRSWAPKSGKPKYLVFLVHGILEHGGRYAGLAHWLTEKGAAVYAHDHVGHGRSVPRKDEEDCPTLENGFGIVNDWNDMVNDSVHFINTKAQEADVAELPILVLGHSMGSLIATETLAKLQREGDEGVGVGKRISKTVISGCAFHPGPASASPLGIRGLYFMNKLPALMRGLGSVFAKLDPKGPNAPVLRASLTHNQSVLDRIDKDALHNTDPVRNKTGYEVLKLIGAARQGVKSLRYPLLMIHGEDDDICYPSGAHEYLDSVGSTQKSLKVYPGLLHEVLFDVPEGKSELTKDLEEYVADMAP
ncbi:unnamed protein product [Chrysoparadoxa australica]